MAEFVLHDREKKLFEEIKAVRDCCDVQINFVFDTIETMIKFIPENKSEKYDELIEKLSRLKSKIEIYQNSLRVISFVLSGKDSDKLYQINWAEIDSRGNKKPQTYKDNITTEKIIYVLGEWRRGVSNSVISVNNAIPENHYCSRIKEMCEETEKRIAGIVKNYVESFE